LSELFSLGAMFFSFLFEINNLWWHGCANETEVLERLNVEKEIVTSSTHHASEVNR